MFRIGFPLWSAAALVAASTSGNGIDARLALADSATAPRMPPPDAALDEEPPAGAIDPFLSDAVGDAIEDGVTHFYFTSLHGDSENLPIMAELAQTLKSLGREFVVCREMSPSYPRYWDVHAGNIAAPHLRADASRWMAELIAEFPELMEPTAAARFQEALAGPEATPCALRLHVPSQDMARLIEGRMVAPGRPGQDVIYLADVGANHGLAVRFDQETFWRPWRPENGKSPYALESKDGDSFNANYDAFRRRHAAAPGSVAVIVSSQCLSNSKFSADEVLPYFVEEGFAVAQGPFNRNASIALIVPETNVARLQGLAARRAGAVELDGAGSSAKGCPPARYPRAIRRFVGSLVSAQGVEKIFVARHGTARTVPLVTEALRGAVDTRPVGNVASVAFYCAQSADFEATYAGWASTIDRRLSLTRRLAWEMLDGGVLDPSQERRFGQAMAFHKVAPQSLRFASDGADDVETLLSDSRLAVASFGHALAVEAFALASARGVPALLLLEADDVPASLPACGDCKYVVLPLMDSTALAIFNSPAGRTLAPLGASPAADRPEL
ncbi:hypothetical protein [Ramlibacter sp.]|uniref:hypothetical protein n=1 Tax=Ramlibacter sp. TaxID=1917967 RepID=UPI003D10BF01